MLVVQATVIIYARTIYLLPPRKEKLCSIEKKVFLKPYKRQPGCMEISFNKNINNNNISDSKRYKIFRA